MATTVTRFPGVYFSEPPPEVLDESLPRMDIALFVGFALRGEPNTPVVIEDAAQFTRQFGDDVELCWDTQTGETVYGHLGAAVRAFFRNGGRRCWVVRVPHDSTELGGRALANLFLDPRLAGAGSPDELLKLVDFYRSQQVGRVGFQGIHAALDPGENCDMNEITLIAAPDAVQLGWATAPVSAAEPLLPSDPLDHPQWWHFMGCGQAPQEPAARAHLDRAEFQNSDLVELAPPQLNPVTVTPAGDLQVSWTWVPPDASDVAPIFILAEARLNDWRDAATIYSGSRPTFTLRGRQAGEYFYRVRVEQRGETSNWSNGIAVQRPGPRRLFQNALNLNTVQLTIHKALLMLCAARGDCLAVLALPRPLRDREARAYCRTLRNAVDERTRTFGAVFHTWLWGHPETHPEQVSVEPPDGAVSGVMAARAATRGVWVSPANEPLQDVFALDLPLSTLLAPDLLTDSVNPVWQAPRGFVTLSALTLSDDPDWREVNVRRLISLLRRLALKHGARYVFEPNGDVLQRSIRQGFENLLRRLFLSGAFAGATANDAFQVVVDEQVNTPQRLDVGQLVIELRVAPSLPMKFVTVRLVQSAESTSIQEIA